MRLSVLKQRENAVPFIENVLVVDLLIEMRLSGSTVTRRREQDRTQEAFPRSFLMD